MRRFACQRLYLSPDTYFIRYVVELGNNGKIQSYYPLEEEIYATQWIGGVIVLSARRKLEPIMPEKNFKTFLAQVLQQSLLSADGILLDQTQDGLLPLLLTLVIPSAGASHVIFSLRCVCVIVCRAVSGQWPGTGRPC